MIDLSCDVPSCILFANVGIYCQAHYVLNKRHGSPEPEFVCKSCNDTYIFQGKRNNSSSWYCQKCYYMYRKLKSEKSFRSGGGNFFSQHGITFGQYLEIYMSQEGKCKICNYQPDNNRLLCIDHDHSCCPTGALKMQSCGNCIRGLLCKSCNKMLGFYENHCGSLSLDVFDKYLVDTPFIFSNVDSGELDHTKRYRDPKRPVRPKGEKE